MPRKGFGGMDLTSPVNRITGKVALALNVRGYWSAAFTLRSLLTDALLAVSAALQTIAAPERFHPRRPAHERLHLHPQGHRGEPLLWPDRYPLPIRDWPLCQSRLHRHLPPEHLRPAVGIYRRLRSLSPNVEIVADSFFCAGDAQSTLRRTRCVKRESPSTQNRPHRHLPRQAAPDPP